MESFFVLPSCTEISFDGVAQILPDEFSLFSVVGLSACTLVLAVGGMMMFDLMLNIWSWDSPSGFSSAIMDSFLGK